MLSLLSGTSFFSRAHGSGLGHGVQHIAVVASGIYIYIYIYIYTLSLNPESISLLTLGPLG